MSQFITKPAGLDQFLEIGKIIKDLLAGSKPLTVDSAMVACTTAKSSMVAGASWQRRLAVDARRQCAVVVSPAAGIAEDDVHSPMSSA